MTDDFAEIADSFGELADQLEQAVDAQVPETEEPVKEGPDVPDVSIDVPGEPEYTYPSLEEMAEQFDTTVGQIQESVPKEVLEDRDFWSFISANAGLNIALAPLEQPLTEAEREGPTPVEVIRKTTLADVASVDADEGQVDVPTSAENVGTPGESRFIEALTGVRSRDQKLDNLKEARDNLAAARDVSASRLAEYREDRETLRGAITAGEGDVGLMRSLVEVLEGRIAEGEDIIALATEKVERAESRAQDLLSDRNEYRGLVKAIINYTRASDDAPLAGNIGEIYRGYRIRSGADVPFRPRAVTKVIVMVEVRNNRGESWVSFNYLRERGQDVYEIPEDRIAAATNLLLTTGELVRRENEVRFDPLIE